MRRWHEKDDAVKKKIHPALEIIPFGDGLRLVIPEWGRELDATRLQLSLLQCFEAPRLVDEVLSEHPFQRKSSEAFLARAQKYGFLLDVNENGEPRFQDRSGVPVHFARAPGYDEAEPSPFVILGIPWDRDVTGRAGARMGPQSIRHASMSARYQVDPVTFSPLGFHDYASGETLLRDVFFADAGDVWLPFGEDSQQARERVTRVIRSFLTHDGIPVVFGGDHSITGPILRAYRELGPMQIVHFDAHTDLGELGIGKSLHHGNVMTWLLEECPNLVAIHQIGLRGIYDAHVHVDHPKVKQVGMHGFRRSGIDAILDDIDPNIPAWISLDIDVVDPMFAPATGTPVCGGMLPHEIVGAVRTVAASVPAFGLDIVEVAEAVSHADATASLAVECAFAFMQGVVDSQTDGEDA